MASTLKVNTIAHSGGTNAMTVDGTGNVTFAKNNIKLTTPPFFVCDISANITGYNSNTTDGSVYIQWNREDTNDGGHMHTSGGNIGKFIAPMAGIYFFDTSVYTSGSMTHHWLYVNGTRLLRGDRSNLGQPSTVSLGTWHVKLAANDEVTVHVYLSGATNNTINANGFHTWFRGGLLHAV